MNTPDNILIVRTDRIGDVILTLPIAAIIKKHSPQSKITLLLRDYTAPLAENNPYIDEVITVVEKNGKPDIAANVALLRNRFSFCIVAYPTFPLALILFLSKIRVRIGSGYRWYSFLFSNRIYEHRKYGDRHELEFNASMLTRLGIDEPVDENSVKFGIAPSAESLNKVQKDVTDFGIAAGKKIIILHPGSGGSSIDLPGHKMKELIGILSKLDVGIIITGSNSEKELCSSFVVSNNVFNAAGRYDLKELIALISLGDVMIANSTGPIHIAAALNKFVVGFYPKIPSCSSKRWGPYTSKKKIFSPSIPCADCTREQCERLNCMESINIAEVAESVKNFISQTDSK